jgi:hypothetical protein
MRSTGTLPFVIAVSWTLSEAGDLTQEAVSDSSGESGKKRFD